MASCTSYGQGCIFEDDHSEAEEDPYADVRVTQDHLLQQPIAGVVCGARPALHHGFNLGFAASRLTRCIPADHCTRLLACSLL
jgi:hypothetical protein